MKKNLNLLTTLLMSSLVTMGLVACNNSNTDNSSNKETSSIADSSSSSTQETSSSSADDGRVDSKLSFDKDKPVTINFYTSVSKDGYGKSFDEYLNKFQKLYPNITVSHERQGGYDNILSNIKTEIASNSLKANLAYCYPDHVAYYNKSRCVQTLDKFIYDNKVDDKGNYLYAMSDDQINDFIPSYWEEGKAYGNDLMYTLPLYKSTELMFYNKTVLDKHNLEVPTHWFSTDENDKTSMEYVCSVLRSQYPNDYPLAVDSEANFFITLCEQYGSPYTSATGEHYLFNNDTNKEFVKKFADWYKKGYMTTSTIIGGSYCSSLFKNLSDDSAKTFMCIGSSAGTSHQFPDMITDPETGEESPAFEVGIAPLPQINIDKPKAISQGPSICIFKNDDPQVVMASWLLLRYLTTSIDFQGVMSNLTGYAPVIESVFENETFSKWYYSADNKTAKGLIALAVKTTIDNKDMYYTSPAFVGSSQARSQVGSLFVSALQETNLTNESLSKMFADAVDACKRDE